MKLLPIYMYNPQFYWPIYSLFINLKTYFNINLKQTYSDILSNNLIKNFSALIIIVFNILTGIFNKAYFEFRVIRRVYM